MHLRLHRVLLLLLSTWLTISFCFSLHDDRSSFAERDETKWLAPLKRGYNPCRSRCSSKSCCQLPPSASNEEDAEGVSARSLDARALFEVDEDTVDAEIVKRFTERRVKLIFDSGDGSDDSTSAWKPITSRSRAFDLERSLRGTLLRGRRRGLGDAAFREHVGDFLKNGAKDSGGLAEFAARLTKGNADVAAYILTPQQELSDGAEGAPGYVEGQIMYADQVQKLVDLLPDIIPGPRDHIEVNHYQALDGMTNEDGEDVNPGQARLLDTTARGRILLQYDPQNNGVRTVRLFFESKLIFNRQLGAAAGPN
ncbi:hypothetical protein NW759_008978 [Fusarium solani]|nr:hypothetical protein NW759_008978 [Fusarium solani]